jgi:hypothetical protein
MEQTQNDCLLFLFLGVVGFSCCITAMDETGWPLITDFSL